MKSHGAHQANANLAHSDDANLMNQPDEQQETDEHLSQHNQVTALLAQAFSLTSHNETARDFIADALGSL